MLQNLRDLFPKWLTVIILGLIVFLLAFLGLHSDQGEESKAAYAVVAKVNRKKIRRSILNTGYERLKQQQQVQLGANFKMTPWIEQQLRAKALQQLILTETLKQNADQQGYRVHSLDIVKSLQHIPIFRIQDKFSSKRFREIVTAAGHTERSFLSALEESILINQARSGIFQSAFILPEETKLAIRLVKQTRDFDYLILPAQRFYRKHAWISRQEASAFYEQNMMQFHVPEQVKLNYVTVELPSIIEQLREKHPTWEVRQIQEAAEKQFSDTIRQLIQLNYRDSSLDKVAELLKLPLHTTEFFSRQGGRSSVTQHPDVIAVALSPEGLKGKMSPMISLGADRIALLQKQAYKAPRLKAFEEVEWDIRQALNRQKAQREAYVEGHRLLKELKQHAHKHLPEGLTWHSVKKATRYTKEVPSAVLNAAFKMPRLQGQEAIMGFTLPQKDFVIIRVTNIQDGQVNQLTPAQYAIYQEELATEQGQFEYILYTQGKLRRAKINYQLNP